MRPECVLDQKQRRYRFRKAISRKEAAALAENRNEEEESDEVEEMEEAESEDSSVSNDQQEFNLPLRKRAKMREGAFLAEKETQAMPEMADKSTSTDAELMAAYVETFCRQMLGNNSSLHRVT